MAEQCCWTNNVINYCFNNVLQHWRSNNGCMFTVVMEQEKTLFIEYCLLLLSFVGQPINSITLFITIFGNLHVHLLSIDESQGYVLEISSVDKIYMYIIRPKPGPAAKNATPRPSGWESNLCLIMYILSTLEFPTHNLDFHLLTLFMVEQCCNNIVIMAEQPCWQHCLRVAGL